MAMITVTGAGTIPDPSEFTWGLHDISTDGSGRSETGLMYKTRITQKREIALGWQNLKPEDVSTILKAFFTSVYITVTYPDAMTGANRTATFYVGDATAPVRQWYLNGERFSKVSFTIIER